MPNPSSSLEVLVMLPESDVGSSGRPVSLRRHHPVLSERLFVLPCIKIPRARTLRLNDVLAVLLLCYASVDFMVSFCAVEVQTSMF